MVVTVVLKWMAVVWSKWMVVVAGDVEMDGGGSSGETAGSGIEMDGGGPVKMDGRG